MNPVASQSELRRFEKVAKAADISVAVVGMGYVGLPTAIALGVAGHPVIGLDISQRRLATIASGDAELLDHEQVLAARAGQPRAQHLQHAALARPRAGRRTQAGADAGAPGRARVERRPALLALPRAAAR